MIISYTSINDYGKYCIKLKAMGIFPLTRKVFNINIIILRFNKNLKLFYVWR